MALWVVSLFTDFMFECGSFIDGVSGSDSKFKKLNFRLLHFFFSVSGKPQLLIWFLGLQVHILALSLFQLLSCASLKN